MFKFNELKQIHLEITNNCQASCPMCSRNINGGGVNPLIINQEWTIEKFKTIMNLEVLMQITGFYLCGTFGDPMMNDNMIEMCRYATEVNPNIQIHVHTNGGARKSQWWVDLARALPKNHLVVFGIDGLEDTNHLYRVGVNYNTVIKNVKAFIGAGGKAQWAFIKFKHNEHQLEQAKNLSKELGFESFHYKESSRFILEPRVKVVNRTGEITHYIEPSSETTMRFINQTAIDNYKKIVDLAKIECVVLKTKEIYIDAYGDLYACCWLANTPYTHISQDAMFEVRNKIKEQHKKMIELLGEVNTFKRSIKDIISSDAYQDMWKDMWNGANKNIICARSCGKHQDIEISQCTDQFLEITKFNE
jgi:MoaA/NifB/PqqE/SkfB family radical SAM enzyme